MGFQISRANDTDNWIHRDWPNYELSGLIHLSPRAHPSFGTAFHRHDATALDRDPAAAPLPGVDGDRSFDGILGGLGGREPAAPADTDDDDDDDADGADAAAAAAEAARRETIVARFDDDAERTDLWTVLDVAGNVCVAPSRAVPRASPTAQETTRRAAVVSSVATVARPRCARSRLSLRCAKKIVAIHSHSTRRPPPPFLSSTVV